MNKILPLLGLLIYSYTCNAQSASPNVLNTTGKTVKGKNVQLSWSIGEIAITTLTAAGTIVTEGFLQPDVVSTSAIEEVTLSNAISCFPNPVHNELYIRQSADIIGSVSVYNALGERVYDQKFIDGIIDMSLYRPGFYFINITNKDGGEVHTFKIVKY
jgi:hypothetical protein